MPSRLTARLAPLCAAVALLTGGAVHAQPATPATVNASHPFAIAAGPLADTLVAIARRSGQAVSVDPSLVAGKNAPAIQGEMSVEAALTRALAGSGLTWTRTDNGTLTLKPLPQDSVTLAPVRVQAASETTTEGSRSYATPAITTFKAAQSIRRTPQPVTVVSRQLLEDRFLPDLHDVLLNTPGVTVDYTDSERVTYWSRGYQIDSLQIDGMTMSQGGSQFIQPDTAVLDRVEILRGSAGMLRGSGNPSATVNLVRKRPTAETRGSLGASFGTWDRQRFEGDLSGALTDSGAIRGRVIAVSDKKDFFQRARDEERTVFYGVVEADLTSRTLLTASYQHTELDATGAWGNLPADFDGSQLDLPRRTYLGAAWNQWNRWNEQTFAEVEHTFDSDWKVKVNASQVKLRLDDYGFKQSYFTRASTTDPYLFSVTGSIYDGGRSDQTVIGASASGPLQLFGREHQLLAGAERVRVKSVDSSGVFNLNPVLVDIRTWNPYTSMAEPFAAVAPGGSASYFAGPASEIRQEGVYGTARLSIADPLSVIVGARLSWWETESSTNVANSYEIDRELTPYVGVIYDVASDWSVYASYTEIFTPQNVKGANGDILEPIRGEDYEAGIKGEHFGGRLNTSLSLFRIDNVGKAVEDTSSRNPCTPYFATGYCRVADGETRSEGWEVEVSGEVLPGWQLMGGYTNTRTEYVRDTSAANIGQPLRTADPRHLVRLFTTYRFDGLLQGLTVGGGVQAQSDIYSRSGAVVVSQGGYAIYNAMASYRLDNGIRLQLNGNNLTDKVYYKKVGTGINNYYGDPRNIMLSVGYEF